MLIVTVSVLVAGARPGRATASILEHFSGVRRESCRLPAGRQSGAEGNTAPSRMRGGGKRRRGRRDRSAAAAR
jgi:hypothetical protein